MLREIGERQQQIETRVIGDKSKDPGKWEWKRLESRETGYSTQTKKRPIVHITVILATSRLRLDFHIPVFIVRTSCKYVFGILMKKIQTLVYFMVLILIPSYVNPDPVPWTADAILNGNLSAGQQAQDTHLHFMLFLIAYAYRVSSFSWFWILAACFFLHFTTLSLTAKVSYISIFYKMFARAQLRHTRKCHSKHKFPHSKF